MEENFENTNTESTTDDYIQHEEVISEEERHNQEMLELAKNTTTRDKNGFIEVVESEPESEEVEDVPEVDETESEEPEVKSLKIEEHEVQNLDDAVSNLSDSQEAFKDLLNTARDKGITDEFINSVMDEISDTDTLSPKTIKALQEYGYTERFVKNYMAQQKAVVEQYAQSLVNYVGGTESWNSIISHLETNPAMLGMLQSAMDSNNIENTKAILNMTMNSINSTNEITKYKEDQKKIERYGEKKTNSVANVSKPQSQPVQKTGFSSQKEMVAAINNPKYANDESYRKEVQLKIQRSNF
ncbi:MULTISPECIES: hypothetical protein [unclassified Tatumella]|uniref:capsid assembly protein n=1 Tax=unclassified Tatumella TaxID=2649542 RepID=UPI001BAF3369|nr:MULTISPECIES: hypothetical protein [unclassified Tatumella]MBS0878858.1 hypothetical protein [Tatumella sp. JGM82]MBS0892367.1 hypothetical protein [Tatumella sp. JGM94]MBS0903456.1 hypothetical protein [Tatumella sp. JGM100]